MALNELNMTLNIDTSECQKQLERTIELVKELRESIGELAETLKKIGASLTLTEQ